MDYGGAHFGPGVEHYGEALLDLACDRANASSAEAVWCARFRQSAPDETGCKAEKGLVLSCIDRSEDSVVCCFVRAVPNTHANAQNSQTKCPTADNCPKTIHRFPSH